MPEYLKDFVKDPQAKLDYKIDYQSNGYLESGETLVESTWSVPEGLEQGDPHPDEMSSFVTTIWLSGGTEGLEYQVTNHIVTSLDRTDDRSITVRVEQR